MKHIRSLVYRWGFRPKYGTVLYSPSLDLIYACRGIDWSACFKKENAKDGA